jgi:probable phosphoglycerate mutase
MMGARRVVIWRHGQTAYNKIGRIQGATDIPLDEVGLEQAAVAAEQLAAAGPAMIVSSDLVRAVATAQALAGLVGLEVAIDPRLRERNYGQWEGLSVSELEPRWPAEYARWRAGEDIPEVGMEPRAAAALRTGAAIREAAAAAPDDSLIVVATHGGCSVCAITDLLELDPTNWLGLRVMRNAHWAVLEGGGRRRPAWRLVGYDLGDVAGRPGMTPWF